MFKLESDIIYGPILSRRLGRSLGVNLLPTDHKVCSFDCVYCYYGNTDVRTRAPSPAGFPESQAVLDAVAAGLREYPHVDHLTFAGNGEPTLHPDFPAIVVGVRRLRSALAPQVKLAIFSNSTTLGRPAVREALAAFDVPILKLDAGDAATFAQINRPAPGVTLEDVLGGLAQVPALITQSVLIAGRVSNAQGDALAAWLEALARVRPAEAQIYTVHPAVPIPDVHRVPFAELGRIAALVQERVGVRVSVY